jgi:hypothetical protein
MEVSDNHQLVDQEARLSEAMSDLNYRTKEYGDKYLQLLKTLCQKY